MLLPLTRSAFVPIAHLTDASGFIGPGNYLYLRNRDECATSLRLDGFRSNSICQSHNFTTIVVEGT